MTKTNTASTTTSNNAAGKMSLRDQLAVQFKKPATTSNNGGFKNTPFINNRLPNLTSIGVDGVDHININAQGQSELGQFLGLTCTMVPVTHPSLGRFNSVHGFWNWVLSENHDDRFRTVSIKVMKGMLSAGKQAGEKRLENVANFIPAILDMCYRRILGAEALKNAVIESVLPFDFHYSFPGSVVKRTEYASWVVMGHEEIRRALKEDRAPCFDQWRTNDDADIYAGIKEIICMAPVEVIRGCVTATGAAEQAA